MMKKLLIGSTALFAVGALSNTAMAEPAQLKISGQVDVAYSVIDGSVNTANTDGTDGDGLGFGNSSSQLIFDWTGVTDTGLEYGARLDYRFQSNTTDEQYVFVGGDWGRLHIGGDDGVIDNNVPGGESVLRGAYAFDGNHFGGTTGAVNASPTLQTGTDDAMKFSYYSPNFAGFSFGASYVPDPGNGSTTTGSGVNNDSGVNANRGDSGQYEGTIAYSGEFSGVGIGAGIGYAHQNGGDQNTVGTSFEDNTGLVAGATVSFAGFSLGLGYGSDGDTGCTTANTVSCDGGSWYNVGLAYSFGPGGISVAYIDRDQQNAASGNLSDDVQFLGFDADYRLAEGLQVFAGLNFIDSKDGSTNTKGEITQGLVGTRVSF